MVLLMKTPPIRRGYNFLIVQKRISRKRTRRAQRKGEAFLPQFFVFSAFFCSHSLDRLSKTARLTVSLTPYAIDPETQCFQHRTNIGAAISLQDDLLPVEGATDAELPFEFLGQIANHDRVRARQFGESVDDHDDLASAVLCFPAQNKATARIGRNHRLGWFCLACWLGNRGRFFRGYCRG